ncbi:hypothetical protein ABZV34_37295 [Streptomyces sp. NPDC005195]|uniref:hypothetical protein n=1 Tax=Streptomyces sp. NPDC005195 TaxID=3154561 RepID=UPI0033B518F8
MLLRLPYLAVSSVFAFIRLLPMSAADKDIETLTPRHQLAVLQRQIDRPRVTIWDLGSYLRTMVEVRFTNPRR